MPHPNELIAQSWLAASNAHNLEALLALYHQDATHYSPTLRIRQPQTDGFIKGKEQLMEWWQEALERLPSLQYQTTTITADDSKVFMEYTRRVDGEPDMLMAEILVIDDGLIIASRVYHG